MMAGTAIAGLTSAYGAYQQGQMAKAVGRNNQIVAEYAARNAQRRGEEQAIEVQRRAGQIKGAQRARAAAAGLDVSTGTPAELQDQTDFFGEIDTATTRMNARNEAADLRYKGQLGVFEGDAAARQGTLAAFSTLLGTGASVAGKWMQYGAPPATDPRYSIRGQRGYD